MIYENFLALMEKEILPRQEKNPDHVRLDGRLSGAIARWRDNFCMMVRPGRFTQIRVMSR